MTTNIALIDSVLAIARVDGAPYQRQPAPSRVALSAVLGVAASLVIDAIIVVVGTTVFPSTAGYSHFRFDDYAKLTIIGVVIGCAGWPIITRLTSTPRWLFSRLAVLMSLVLFLPDVWLLLRHQPAEAVAVLMTMHVAVALVTYQLVIRVAPVREHDGGNRTTLR